MNSLIHITPQLPPAIDGVGDYCWNLWRHWPQPLPPWRFLVTRGAREAAALWPEVQIDQFELSKNALRAALEQRSGATIVLHYVSYGYQPKGIPVWLPGAIAEWKRSAPQRRLFTMFHEMYARSSPLRSPFWIAPVARRIIRELVGLSEAWVTSCERYFRQLTAEFYGSAELGRIIPIGSNIPVAQALSSKWDEDAGRSQRFRFVVFGLAKTRLWALERHWHLLRALNEAGAIESITLLGKHNDPEDERAWQRWKEKIGATVNWRKRFDLSKEDISRELLGHDFGLLANEPDILTKSGVFAALASHGTIPILSARSQADLPPSLSDAAIANDDGAGLPHLMRMLGDAVCLRQRREHLLELSGRELAWKRIAENWSQMLSAPGMLTDSQSFAAQDVDGAARPHSERRALVVTT
ncbi:MAG TPA: hypothetical protein VNT99_15865 [Methylomirabilota bacterium]|nr:hypothetical protein [Methylomirabilota bacterium]